MAKIPFDWSFERAGRPLCAWLVDLVADDFPTRLMAGGWIQAMQFGHPSFHTDVRDLDYLAGNHPRDFETRFASAVRACVAAPEFARQEFVPRLIHHRLAIARDWRERCDRGHAQHRDDDSDPISLRLRRRLEAAGTEAEREQVEERIFRWASASSDRDRRRWEAATAGAEHATAVGHMTRTVFEALDRPLLADRAGLRLMLEDEDLRIDALMALGRIGPPALDFAPDVFDLLDAKTYTSYRSSSGEALGSIGRDDPGVIDGLLARLRSGPRPVRSGAAGALQAAGSPLAGRLEVALDLLFAATGDPEIQLAAIPALASLGRDRLAVLDHVLGFARPRPPRLVTQQYEHFEHTYDEVMHERGVAIDALRFFEGFAERVVPVLIDALDSFEEYDPDWYDNGEWGRACSALESFGPAAVPAIPRLIGLLDAWQAARSDGDEWPKGIFRVLKAIGPAAGAALPVLRAIRAETYDADDPCVQKLDPDDPLDRAILAIEGG